MRISILFVNGFYDGPLNGVCFNLDNPSRLLWFDLDREDEETVERFFNIYDLTDEEAHKLVVNHFYFEREIGLHNCRHLSGQKNKLAPTSNKDWQKYYNTKIPVNLNLKKRKALLRNFSEKDFI